LAPHCGETECEEEIKYETGGVKALCIPFEQPEESPGTCPKCGKRGKYWVYFAKSY
ncbi:MAG: proline--tRNA ligase, partial [Candidatus Micrarchaeota archaeon]|nr:proline--tRNA ligase [Candidatus Micrarchaeota archaeon]